METLISKLDVKVKQRQLERTVWSFFDWGLSEGMNTKVKDLTPSFSCLFVYPQLSCFSPLAALLSLIPAPPIHPIDISCICIVTRRSVELSPEYKYTNLLICKETKASDYVCSLSFWTALSCKILLSGFEWWFSSKLKASRMETCSVPTFHLYLHYQSWLTVSAVPAWQDTFKNCFVKYMKNFKFNRN